MSVVYSGGSPSCECHFNRIQYRTDTTAYEIRIKFELVPSALLFYNSVKSSAMLVKGGHSRYCCDDLGYFELLGVGVPDAASKSSIFEFGWMGEYDIF